MTTYLASNAFYFSDGTALATANLPWSNITGTPTALSQFSNNVPYLTGTGGFVNCQQTFGNCGNIGYSNIYVNTYRSGTTLYAVATRQNCYNCNCNCNCNC